MATGKEKFSAIFSCAKWPHSRVRLICTKTPTQKQVIIHRPLSNPDLPKPRPTVHTKTGQPPKYGHSPPAQLSPAKPTTKCTKSKNMPNSTSFVFHIRPANKIYFLETFDLYQNSDLKRHEPARRT